MPVSFSHIGPIIFFQELGIQHAMAKVAFDKLKEAAPGWYEHADRKISINRMPPREILMNCTVFLSSAAVISRIIFEGRRTNNTIHKRCSNIRKFLEIQDLPLLKDLSVRNAFEHVDERLDNIFSDLKTGSISPLSITEKPPSSDSIVLKRFDPRNLTVSYAGVELSLEACMEEISKVESRIRPALGKIDELGMQTYDLWAT